MLQCEGMPILPTSFLCVAARRGRLKRCLRMPNVCRGACEEPRQEIRVLQPPPSWMHELSSLTLTEYVPVIGNASGGES